MAFDIVTLTPVNVQLGGTDVGLNDTYPLPGPIEVGGGSISDGSDLSYLELGSRYNWAEGGERTDLLLADFVFDTTAHPDPTWLYVSVRMMNEPAESPERPGYRAALATYSLLPVYSWYRSDGTGGALDREGMPAAIADGEVDSPAWFNQFYRNEPILPGDPGDDTNWANLPRDWPEMLDPLTTSGLRFGMFCTSSAPDRIPLIDVFEIRLVVACPAPVPPASPVRAIRSTPSLRMLQRGGQGGMSGIPRMIGNPVRGLRQGPGSVY